MKNNLKLIASIAAIGLVTACSDADNEQTTSESSTTTTESGMTNTDSSMMTSEASGSTGGNASGSASLDESASYVNLKTNKQVRVKREPSTGFYVDYETNEPLMFFYNPTSKDTFNQSGQVVNNYLIRGTNGNYKMDETRWRVKVDEDGDMKAKDGDEAKIKIDGNGKEMKIKTDSSKEKIDENSYKLKTKNEKVKVKKD